MKPKRKKIDVKQGLSPEAIAARAALRLARIRDENEFRWWKKHFKPLFPDTPTLNGPAGKHKTAILYLMRLDYHQLQFLVKVSKKLLKGQKLPAYKPLLTHRKPGPVLVDAEDDDI